MGRGLLACVRGAVMLPAPSGLGVGYITYLSSSHHRPRWNIVASDVTLGQRGFHSGAVGGKKCDVSSGLYVYGPVVMCARELACRDLGQGGEAASCELCRSAAVNEGVGRRTRA